GPEVRARPEHRGPDGARRARAPALRGQLPAARAELPPAVRPQAQAAGAGLRPRQRQRPHQARGRDRRPPAVGRRPGREGHDARVRGRPGGSGADRDRGSEHRPRRRGHGPGLVELAEASLQLFRDSAELEDAELAVGGMRASALAEAFGTPLLVYCRETLVAQALAYRAVDPEALVAFGVKAFPNVAVLRLFGEEGLGADVSTGGELEFALRAGLTGDRILFHGNNKSDDELEAAVRAGALVVLDSREEVERAARAGARRVLLRVTPGIAARTHQSIQTAHDESKFGLDPEQALAALRDALAALEPVGLHVHIGSQLGQV